MIPRRTVLRLGASQLICWGVTYYLIGIFGDRIADDLGWSATMVHGGFSVALLVMGITSPVIGRMIDRHGGGRVMAVGSVLSAAGCAGVAVSTSLVTYYVAWVCLGAAMRCTLYDAAFAALARIGGPTARRAMSQITLPGGLASTAFWPIGHGLAELVGWRGALFCYAGIALLTLPLHLAVPGGRYDDGPSSPAAEAPAPLAVSRRDRLVTGSLYAILVTLAGFLAAGMSAHMVGLLVGLGVAASAAVWVSALRGVAQSVARLADVVFGRGIHPLDLNLMATCLLPVCFVAGIWSGQLIALAIAFTVLYGAGNGLATITRGSLPLVLFDHRTYGAFVGRLLLPGFVLSAAAPVTYAFMIDAVGERGALLFSALLGAVMLAAAVALKGRARRSR